MPCNTDQDCGNDFVCAPAVSGTCSSGGGSGTATPVASDPATGSPVAPRDSDGSTPIASDGGTTCTTVTSLVLAMARWLAAPRRKVDPQKNRPDLC